MKHVIYIFLSLIHYCLSPHFGCPKDRPFITGVRKCGSFSDICWKLGSEDCDFAIRACEQCPLSNFSSAILDRVLRTSYIGENKNCTPAKIEMKPIKECPTNLPLLIVLIVLSTLTILLILILEVYLIKNKSLQGRKRKSRIIGKEEENIPFLNVIPVNLGEEEENIPLRNGDTVDSTIYRSPTDSIFEDRLKQMFKYQSDSINKRLQEFAEDQNHSIYRKFQQVAGWSTKQVKFKGDKKKDQEENHKSEDQNDSINRKLQEVAENYLTLKEAQTGSMNMLENISNKIGVGTCFKIPQFHKSLKLIVHENDNIVSIKRKICANLVNTEKIDDFKMMQLQYNGEVLDDNQYFPKIVGLESNPILCYMNEELKYSTTLLQLRGNIYVPEMIQLEKGVNISQLKQIVNKENINLNNLFIIKGSEILESNNTIEECKLEDNDLLKVIKNENRTINVKQVFKDYSTGMNVQLHIDNIAKVREIKSKILEKLEMKQELKDIFLFYGSNYLHDNMFFFEFDSGEYNEMSYCNLVDANFLLQNQELKPIGTGDHNEIYECLDWSRRKIILKKSNSDIKQNQSLINELMMFHETKSNSRFVQLLGIFRNENSFYVAVEKMSDNSISDFIKKKFPISESRIIKWSQQILEGLEFLHSRQIIHRNIKPSNILLNDDGNNAKISSFGLSRHLYGKRCVLENDLFSKVEILRYMAPEMYVEMVYDFKSEVYSFGVTLTEIITGKIPYEDQLNGDDALEQIRNMGPLVISSENKKLESFVNSCLKYKPEDRPSISDLLKFELVLDKI